jgi:alpha-N-arabinofuranosidase
LSATLDERSHELILKAVNYAATPAPVEIRLDGLAASGKATVTTLASADLAAENSFDHPTAVSPQSSTLEVSSGAISTQLLPYSVIVYRIPTR